MARPKLPGELTWPKLLGTCLAAVVAAWLGGRLGLGGTLTGVAIGSVIATFGSAFFTTTIDKTHKVIPTVLVRTDRGTVVETRADRAVTVEDAGETTVLPAVQDPASPPWGAPGANDASRWSQIHWKAVAAASLLTMGMTLGAISIYESAVGRTWGSNEPGTTLGNTVRGGPAPVAPALTPTPAVSEDPTEEPTPSEESSESPTPSGSPTPSPSPSETDCPTPTASPNNLTSPDVPGDDCPTPTVSPSAGGGPLR